MVSPVESLRSVDPFQPTSVFMNWERDVSSNPESLFPGSLTPLTQSQQKEVLDCLMQITSFLSLSNSGATHHAENMVISEWMSNWVVDRSENTEEPGRSETSDFEGIEESEERPKDVQKLKKKLYKERSVKYKDRAMVLVYHVMEYLNFPYLSKKLTTLSDAVQKPDETHICEQIQQILSDMKDCQDYAPSGGHLLKKISDILSHIEDILKLVEENNSYTIGAKNSAKSIKKYLGRKQPIYQNILDRLVKIEEKRLIRTYLGKTPIELGVELHRVKINSLPANQQAGLPQELNKFLENFSRGATKPELQAKLDELNNNLKSKNFPELTFNETDWDCTLKGKTMFERLCNDTFVDETKPSGVLKLMVEVLREKWNSFRAASFKKKCKMVAVKAKNIVKRTIGDFIRNICFEIPFHTPYKIGVFFKDCLNHKYTRQKALSIIGTGMFDFAKKLGSTMWMAGSIVLMAGTGGATVSTMVLAGLLTDVAGMAGSICLSLRGHMVHSERVLSLKSRIQKQINLIPLEIEKILNNRDVLNLPDQKNFIEWVESLPAENKREEVLAKLESIIFKPIKESLSKIIEEEFSESCTEIRYVKTAFEQISTLIQLSVSFYTVLGLKYPVNDPRGVGLKKGTGSVYKDITLNTKNSVYFDRAKEIRSKKLKQVIMEIQKALAPVLTQIDLRPDLA